VNILATFLEKCGIILIYTNTVPHNCDLVSSVKLWCICAVMMKNCRSAPVSFTMSVPPSVNICQYLCARNSSGLDRILKEDVNVCLHAPQS
jgi:hypothetical protein